MATLLTTYGIVPVLIILLVAIPELLRLVKWIVTIVKEHKQSYRTSFEAGKEKQKRKSEEQDIIRKLAEREDILEAQNKTQQESINKLECKVDDLAAFNNLAIMKEIKQALDRVHAGESLDAYEMDLLQRQFQIYTRNGGNSWAARMMEELQDRAVTIEIKDIHKH